MHLFIRSHILIGALWLVVVSIGLLVLLNYESTPGLAGKPPQTWPQDILSMRSGDKFTLVMLAHPRCPCTRASVSELAALMAAYHNKMNAIVFVLNPSSMPKDWEKSDIWQAAAKIKGVQVLPDPDGLRAREFNSETSGQTILYDKQGKLVFSGGITSARGRVGASHGAKIIASLVNSQGSAPNSFNRSARDFLRLTTNQAAFVFGCPLHNPVSKPR